MNDIIPIHQDAEPTLREETIHMVEHANIDLEYARQQLRRAQGGFGRSTMLNCISRAQDALDRIADAQASMIITLANAQLEPPAEAQEWTVEEILAREA